MEHNFHFGVRKDVCFSDLCSNALGSNRLKTPFFRNCFNHKKLKNAQFFFTETAHLSMIGCFCIRFFSGFLKKVAERRLRLKSACTEALMLRTLRYIIP